MSDNDWAVGQTVTNGVRLYDPATGAEVTTGTATIRYLVNDAGVTKWLQDNLTAISTTANSIDITHTANEGFVHDMAIPASLAGLSGVFIVTDPAGGLDIYSETFEVAPQVATDHVEVRLT